MGKQVARFGDELLGDRGAPKVTISLNTAKTVKVNGKLCAINNSKGPIHGHPITHPDFVNPTIIATTSKVIVEGQPIARLNDTCQCGSKVMTASENVIAG